MRKITGALALCLGMLWHMTTAAQAPMIPKVGVQLWSVRDALQAAGAGTVFYMSSVSHDGVTAVLRAVASLIEDNEVEAAQAADLLSWTPHEQG